MWLYQDFGLYGGVLYIFRSNVVFKMAHLRVNGKVNGQEFEIWGLTSTLSMGLNGCGQKEGREWTGSGAIVR